MALMTIGLPVHNGERFLATCLDSLLAQTFDDFEILISDNASTDGTATIAERYRQFDPRIRVARHPENVGAAENFNSLARRCSSKYFKWAAVDDLIDPTYLSACVAAMEQNDGIVLCHSKTVLIDSDGAPMTGDPQTSQFMTDYGKLRLGDRLVPFGVSDDVADRVQSVAVDMIRCFDIFGVIRSSALKSSTLFGPYYGCDRVMLVELALKGPFHRVDEAYFFKREHARQSSNLKNAQSRQRWINNSNRRAVPLLIPREISKRIIQSDLGISKKLACLAIYLKGANWGRLLNIKSRKTYASS